VSLAGAPLLRKSAVGLEPRPAAEIAALMRAAYGGGADAAAVSRGLVVIAEALNRGDLGRAMIAAVRLRLPDLGWREAARLAAAEDALVKYNPDEPRDWRGRWTTGDAGAPTPSVTPKRIPTPGAEPASRPVRLIGARLIPVGGGPGSGMGDNEPPPEAVLVPEREPDIAAPVVPPGWDRPGQTIDGLYYPPSRHPVLPDGTPWPVADIDHVLSVLANQPGRMPTMVLYVPIDGRGPLLVGSTAKIDYPLPEGYDTVTFKGRPQVTRLGGVPTGHARDGVKEALRLAASNAFSTIYFNRSFSTITNGMVFSRLRPDVVALTRPTSNLPYRHYPYESLSEGQELPDRQKEMPEVPGIAPVDGAKYDKILYRFWIDSCLSPRTYST
jgi:hypothetical protein